MKNNLQKRKTILLCNEEILEILSGDHNEFSQQEDKYIGGDSHELIFYNKIEEFFKTMYYENIEGIYSQQLYATQVFPIERKVTIVMYE